MHWERCLGESDLSQDPHVDYYQRRVVAERELAKAAPNEIIRSIHLELARQYQALIDEPGKRSVLRIVT